MTREHEVLVDKRGTLGLLTLNRPSALNALTHGMVTILTDALERFREDDSIQTIAIRGAGERGLCAGGDIVSLYRDAIEGDGSASAAFWADEYRLNHLIATYPKPYVAFQDGIVLGGGIGVSAHGSHRIVTETSRLGFPEVTIGFVPDVGASWLLSRAPHNLGVRIALTGEHVGAGDAIRVGLADTFVPSDRLGELLTRLETVPPDEAIALVATDQPAGSLRADPAWADAFGQDSVEDILGSLRQLGEDGESVARGIMQKSPTSLRVALKMIQCGARMESLADALTMEYRVALRMLTSHDFAEGVRAQVIDKDRNPSWKPGTLTEITEDNVEPFFAPAPGGDLVLEERP